MITLSGGSETLSLVRSSPDRALAGDTAFLGETLSHSATQSRSTSLHPGIQMGTGELLGNLTNCGGVACDGLASLPGDRNTPSRFMLQKPG